MAKKVTLISDTHGFVDERLLELASESDELWHAGDWGTPSVCEKLEACTTVRGVYGNIDGQFIRKSYPAELSFELEGLTVYLTHIGGYPGRYQRGNQAKIGTTQAEALYLWSFSHT